MTEQEVRTALDGWERLRKRAIEVGREFNKISQGGYVCLPETPADMTLEIEPHYSTGEAWVSLSWEDRSLGYEGASFPLRYLWQPDWAEQEQAHIDAEKRAAAEKKAQEDADREELFEQYDQEDYERLWHKYKGMQP